MEAAGEEALELLLEPKIERLSQLRALRLLNAGLKELPEALWSCRALRQLDVGGNPLSSLPGPRVAEHLKELEILFVSNVGMREPWFHEDPVLER